MRRPKPKKKQPRVAKYFMKYREEMRVQLSQLSDVIEHREQFIQALLKENFGLKTQVAATSGWFAGDLTFRLPAGRFICVDFNDKVASVFNVPENCTDMLQGAGMSGRYYCRIGPPLEEPPQIVKVDKPPGAPT